MEYDTILVCVPNIRYKEVDGTTITNILGRSFSFLGLYRGSPYCGNYIIV
jgi:hypothetical protein